MVTDLPESHQCIVEVGGGFQGLPSNTVTLLHEDISIDFVL
jgi:hypothetical protein